MKRIITYSIIALLQASVALAQTSVPFAKTSPKPKFQKREKYEWQGEIPTYVETLKKELTYPMAWGNSPIKNFKKWKKAARAKGSRMHDDASESGCGLEYGSIGRGTEKRI